MAKRRLSEPPLLAAASLPYENSEFLNGPAGRPLRIMAEYIEPLNRFRRENIHDTVVFFGSARCTSRNAAQRNLALLEKSTGPGRQANLKSGRAALEMARYYEDARRLSYLLSRWSMRLNTGRGHRFVVTSGGGPGIMEAANRGAYEAGAKTIGLNIRLPHEQMPNRYISPDLNFEFHYFFMRKYWFAYLAKALVVFPGGFGTMDELFELLTLAQTNKLAKKILVLVYGKEYWSRVLNFQTLIDAGTISAKDLDLFRMVDSPEEGFEMLREGLTKFHLAPQRRVPVVEPGPEIAKTRG